MATITIRDLNDVLKAKLRVRAAEHGRSMEAEVRAIIAEALEAPNTAGGLARSIHERFAEIGGADLGPIKRSRAARAAEIG